MPDNKTERGFLSRWSQRKTQVLSGDALDDEEQIVDDTELEPEPQDLADENVGECEPTAEELEMQQNQQAAEAINIETLEYSSDYSVFMKRGVSDAVKNAAMQKLWRSNPVLAVLDGLNDYDEDFGDPKLNVFNSIWKVKSGFLNEEELNHKPADKLQAVLDRFTKDEPAEPSTVEDSGLEEVAASPDALDEPVADERAEADVNSDEDNGDLVEYEQPQRVSLRSRIFEETGNAD